MGASWWDQLGLPLLIGIAIQIGVAALCFLSVQFWNCLMQVMLKMKTQAAAGESAHDQPLPEGDGAAPANGVPDLEMGNRYGPVQGGEFMIEPELELGIVNGGQGVDYFSDREARTPVIESPLTTPKTEVTRDAARGALTVRPVDMGVPHNSQ